MVKYLILAMVVILLFGGLSRLIVAGGAWSLNMGDRLLGNGAGATLQVRGQSYAPGARHALDIWVPAGTTKDDRLPVLVWYYGGGWSDGRREDYGFVGRAFARAGFVVVIPDYRLAPQAHWPDFLNDSAAALSWTAQNVARYGGDPSRIAIAGHSAGAYNALMLALDPQWMRGAGSNVGVIRGVAALAGPADFLPFEKGGRADVAMGDIHPPEITQPIHFARRDAPPIWLGHGTADTVVRPRNSRNLAAAITKAGGSVILREYKGAGHPDLVMGLTGPLSHKAATRRDMIDFLRGVTARHVAGPGPRSDRP